MCIRDSTGNGPLNRSQRAMWGDSGWFPKTMNFGPFRVGYAALEPYDLLLSTIADIGDNMKTMGPQWAEDRLFQVSLAIAQGFTQKSYLQGISDLVEVFYP